MRLTKCYATEEYKDNKELLQALYNYQSFVLAKLTEIEQYREELKKEFPNMIYTESMPNFTSYNVKTGDIEI
jgi:hypothetical protein